MKIESIFSERKKNLQMEAEIPFKLRKLGMLLNMKIDFYTALKKISGEEGVFSEKLKTYLLSERKGESVLSILTRFAEDSSSENVKRAVSQLITAYQHGSGGEEIKRIGNEMLAVQKYKTREYASKSSVFGLVFLMFTVIIPSFLIIITAVGNFTFESSIDIRLLNLIILLVIPASGLAILGAMSLQAPPFIFREKEQFPYLQLVFALILIGLIYLNFMNLYLLVPVFAGGLVLFYREYQKGVKTEKIEKVLPDALLEVSTLPKGSSAEQIFRRMAKNPCAEFSSEMEKSWKQIKANVRTEKVLGDLKERIGGGPANMFSGTMKSILETNYFRGFSELAEDILRFFEMRREREGVMSMQKYTMIAGALVIPLIMGVSVRLISEMEGYAGEGMALIAEFTIPVYLVIYAFLVSLYISQTDEKHSSGLLYSFGITLLSLTVFYLV
ncbi:hypothetical protein JXB01_03385 [Candidatus Micrarchaeota archaeon]|nr:hypothetical protein [Candidatus Micrarchaeota archaeon]